MKKKLLLAGATLLLAAAAVTGLAAYDKSSMSELMNANVEEYEYWCDRGYPGKACGSADC